MAVVDINKDIRDVPFQVDIQNMSEAELNYQVITDNASDEEAVVLAAVGIEPGSLHPVFLLLRCFDIQTQRVDTFVWNIRYRYRTDLDLSAQEGDNPIDWTPKVSWSTSWLEVPLTYGWLYDTDGVLQEEVTAVCNSAKDPFDPQPTYQIPIPECRIVRNELVTPLIMNYINHINTNAYTLDGVPIGATESKITGITVAPKQYHRLAVYREVEYTIQCRPRIYSKVKNSRKNGTPVNLYHSAFDYSIADMGLNELADAGTAQETKVRIYQDDGTDSATPGFLDGFGAAIRKIGGTPLTEADVVFRVYAWPLRRSFAPLNLPT